MELLLCWNICWFDFSHLRLYSYNLILNQPGFYHWNLPRRFGEPLLSSMNFKNWTMATFHQPTDRGACWGRSPRRLASQFICVTKKPCPSKHTLSLCVLVWWSCVVSRCIWVEHLGVHWITARTADISWEMTQGTCDSHWGAMCSVVSSLQNMMLLFLSSKYIS